MTLTRGAGPDLTSTYQTLLSNWYTPTPTFSGHLPTTCHPCPEAPFPLDDLRWYMSPSLSSPLSDSLWGAPVSTRDAAHVNTCLFSFANLSLVSLIQGHSLKNLGWREENIVAFVTLGNSFYSSTSFSSSVQWKDSPSNDYPMCGGCKPP